MQEHITAYTKDDVQCVLNSYPRITIQELSHELNMTEKTIKHILKIHGKLNDN